MKIVYNNIIPPEGFLAINLFGLIFIKKKYKHLVPYYPNIINHEAIHSAQMKELAFIFFYIIYFFEWIYRLIFHTKTAYSGLSFEREAYLNEGNKDYLKSRKHFAMWRKK